MMRKKRGYNRDKPQELLRDYKLFAIACEDGRREPNYFRLFEQISKRITVDIIEDIVNDDEMQSKYETKSAPKWVLDRAIKYIESEGLIDEDDLWFVIDKDKWTYEQIKKIADYCKDYPNRHIVISNPCFEVWLYFHKKTSIPNCAEITSKTSKTEVAKLEKGGYHPQKFIPYLFDAISNARNNDTNINHFMPNNCETKMYQLGEALIEVIGKNNFENFLQTKLNTLSL